jgi:hypothetical protein
VSLLHERHLYTKLLREDGKSFKGWTDFCLTPRPFGLGRSPQDIDAIIQEAKDPKTIAEKTQPLAEHGGDRRSEEIQGNNVTLKSRGNSKEYRTARIARDAPDVFERMKAGDFPCSSRRTSGWYCEGVFAVRLSAMGSEPRL